MGRWVYHWGWEPPAAFPFWVAGPCAGTSLRQRFAGAFPEDATVGLWTGNRLHRLSWASVDLLWVGEGEQLGLPASPVGAGPLLYVMDRLLGEYGCPWDRAQTAQDLLRYLLEEAYEAAEALVAEDWPALAEELGDVLLQVVFQAALLRGRQLADFDAIARQEAAKLVRRHPHVFGGERAADAAAVRGRWDAIKAGEKAHAGEAPWVWPALAAAHRLGKRGITPDSPAFRDIRDRVRVYLEQAPGKMEEMLGDCAWAVAEAGRLAHADSEWALWKRMARLERGHGRDATKKLAETAPAKRISKSPGE